MTLSPLVRARTHSCTAAILLVFLAGCPSAPVAVPGQPSAFVKKPLVLLVAEDPQLGQAIAREWRGRTEEELTVRDISFAELTKATRLPGDAVIFESGLIGQLAERGLIVPLENSALEDADFNYRDIFDHVRLREMRWANRTVAAALGSPQLLLCYRSDIFEKLGLEPPTDWTEYQQALERLADRANLGDLAPPADQPWYASHEPLADGWAGQLLLARAAAYALHRDQVSPLFRFDKMTPLIDQPPYVRALEELVAAAKASRGADARLSPSEAFAALRAGHCALALTWPTAGATTESTTPTRRASEGPPASTPDSRQQPKISFARLPGGRQAYRFATQTWEMRSEEFPEHIPLLSISGRMAAVTASSADAHRAAGFVLWLAGRDVSQQIGPHSQATTLFRNSQVASSSRWTPALSPEASRQYAETLAATRAAPRAFPGLLLPGRLDYLAALDEAVRQALADQPAAEALAAAAQKWREITDLLGVENQLRANSRSLGQGEF
jgi:ABC-type glycerol-3-phosphate transport system substrate-binding protein